MSCVMYEMTARMDTIEMASVSVSILCCASVNIGALLSVLSVHAAHIPAIFESFVCTAVVCAVLCVPRIHSSVESICI